MSSSPIPTCSPATRRSLEAAHVSIVLMSLWGRFMHLEKVLASLSHFLLFYLCQSVRIEF